MAVVVGLVTLTYFGYLRLSKKVNILQPNILFSIVILSTFFVTTLKLSNIQDDYQPWFIILILSLIILFSEGYNFVKRIKIRPSSIKYGNYNARAFYLCIMVLWIVILISFAVEIKVMGPPPAISKNIRSEYFLSGWGTLVLLQYVLFGLLLYDYYTMKTVKKVLFFTIQGSLILISVLLSNKTQILYMLMLWLIARNTYKKKINIRGLIPIGIIAVLIFTLFYRYVYLQMYGITIDEIYYHYGIKLPKFLSFLAQPYLYVECNYDNLYHYLTCVRERTYGFKTFGFIFDILGLNSLIPNSISDNLAIWKQVLKRMSLTTGSLFGSFAQDGGILFMIVFTFIFGGVSAYCEKRYYQSEHFSSFYIYASITIAIFMSFFTNFFTDKVVIANIVVAIIIDKLIYFRLRIK